MAPEAESKPVEPPKKVRRVEEEAEEEPELLQQEENEAKEARAEGLGVGGHLQVVRHAVEDEEGAPVINVVGLPLRAEGPKEAVGQVHAVIQELIVVEGIEDGKADGR